MVAAAAIALSRTLRTAVTIASEEDATTGGSNSVGTSSGGVKRGRGMGPESKNGMLITTSGADARTVIGWEGEERP